MKSAFLLIASVALAVLGLSGCSVVPSSIVTSGDQGLTPQMNYPQARPAMGSIYSTSNYRSMFEGRRASNVGDTLTVIITENTSADKNEAGNASKKGSMSIATLNMSGAATPPTFGSSSSYSSQDAGDANNKNTFTGLISVTIIDIRPNGNLVVSGEKQVAFDQGVEFIRLSGVVNPYTITNENTVASSSIADARIEYRTNSTFDAANLVKRLNRFFLSTLPF